MSLVDIYPTVLDGMGIPLLREEGALPGRSIFQLAAEPDDPERLGFSEYHAVGAESGAFMLTRNRFKFHYYVGFPPELFDLKNDPEETCDLAMDPEYGPILAQFERELRTMLDPERVDRLAKADQAVHIARFGGREAALKLGNKGATPAPTKVQNA